MQLQRLSSSRELKDLLPALERFIAWKCEVAQILLLEMRPPPPPPPDAAWVKGHIVLWTTSAAPLICGDKSHLKRRLEAVIQRQNLLLVVHCYVHSRDTSWALSDDELGCKNASVYYCQPSLSFQLH